MAGLGELHDDLALFRDLASTSLDVPKDQRKLLLKNDCGEARLRLCGPSVPPCFAQEGRRFGWKSSDAYDVSTCGCHARRTVGGLAWGGYLFSSFGVVSFTKPNRSAAISPSGGRRMVPVTRYSKTLAR